MHLLLRIENIYHYIISDLTLPFYFSSKQEILYTIHHGLELF